MKSVEEEAANLLRALGLSTDGIVSDNDLGEAIKALDSFADERLGFAIALCVNDGQIALAQLIRNLKSKP